MQLSNRLLIFLLIGAVPIALSGVSPNLLFVGGVYMVLLCVVSAVDYHTQSAFEKH